MDSVSTKVKFKYKKGDLVYLHIYRIRRVSPGVYRPYVSGWFLSVITHRVPSIVKGKRHPCYNARPLNSTQSFMKREEQLRDRISYNEAGGPV